MCKHRDRRFRTKILFLFLQKYDASILIDYSQYVEECVHVGESFRRAPALVWMYVCQHSFTKNERKFETYLARAQTNSPRRYLAGTSQGAQLQAYAQSSVAPQLSSFIHFNTIKPICWAHSIPRFLVVHPINCPSFTDPVHTPMYFPSCLMTFCVHFLLFLLLSLVVLFQVKLTFSIDFWFFGETHVSLVFVWRAKGNWCFPANASRNRCYSKFPQSFLCKVWGKFSGNLEPNLGPNTVTLEHKVFSFMFFVTFHDIVFRSICTCVIIVAFRG